jgi:flagellar assembly protein FliH
LSNIIKGSYINYNKQGPITIESIDELTCPKPIKNIEKDITMNEEEKKRIFEIEMESKKNEIIEKAIIEAKIKANEEQTKILAESNKKAEEMINRANSLLNEAKINSESISKEAFEKGYNDGMSNAENTINQANAILQDITNVRNSEIQAVAPEIIDLICDLFEKVIGAKLNMDDDIVLNLIENTLKKYELKDSIIIKISEVDYNFVNENKQYILSKFKNIDSMEVLKQDSLQKGDCIIHTQSGDIDSSISKQLEYFKTTIQDILRNEIYDDKS